jgi:hypothetical protein
MKPVLQLLLPPVEANLGSTSLANKGLNLGFGIKNVLEAQLASDNIASFMHECSQLCDEELANFNMDDVYDWA